MFSFVMQENDESNMSSFGSSSCHDNQHASSSHFSMAGGSGFGMGIEVGGATGFRHSMGAQGIPSEMSPFREPRKGKSKRKTQPSGNQGQKRMNRLQIYQVLVRPK